MEPTATPVLAAAQVQPEVHVVRLAKLRAGYSPRLVKLDEEHVRALLEVVDRLPPIIVDKRTMTVLDGLHRLEAFRRAGRTELEAFFFIGDEADALAVAVQANIKHGKPLSGPERQAAAAALLRRSPERSDRWVAEVCGLSHSTVARIRRAAEVLDTSFRSGRDGRRRPVDRAQAQAALAGALQAEPTTSARQAAKVAGVAASTAHRARSKLQKPGPVSQPGQAAAREPGGQANELVGQATAHVAAGGPAPGKRAGGGVGSPEPPDVEEWLARTSVSPADLEAHLGDLPLGRTYEVVDECWRRASVWAEIAAALERRVRAQSRRGQDGP